MSALLKKRVLILEETVCFIVNLKLELMYKADNLLTLLSGISGISICKNLEYINLCCDGLRKGDPFNNVWKSAISENRLPYKVEEKTKLISLGEFLGASDKESQAEILSLYEELFTVFLKRAQLENEKYSKIYVMLGFLTGMCILIMVI